MTPFCEGGKRCEKNGWEENKIAKQTNKKERKSVSENYLARLRSPVRLSALYHVSKQGDGRF